jgi:hypothetical protein
MMTLKPTCRIRAGVCVFFLLGLATDPAHAATPPLCEDACGPEVACSTPCRAGGVRTTCGRFGECSDGAPPCPTVQCAAGCALRPSFVVSNATPVIGETVTFTADTSNINPDTANWDLGDGTHVLGVSVDHADGFAATFRACLKANEVVYDTVQTACKYISVADGGGGGGGGCVASTEVPCVAGMTDSLAAVGERGHVRLPPGCRHAGGALPTSAGDVQCGEARVTYAFGLDMCGAGAEQVRLDSGAARVCVVGAGRDARLLLVLLEHGVVFEAPVASPQSALLLWRLAGSFLPVTR